MDVRYVPIRTADLERGKKMRDWMGRDLNYLRLSLTERCNLKCIYCREENEHCKGRHELTIPELTRLMSVFVELGITKVRLTGGEPLVRKDLEEIVKMAASFPQINDLCMTTNAQGLKERIRELNSAGLNRVNVSLDSLDETRYREMTRGGSLTSALDGINAAMELGMQVKINTVLVRGKNDCEVEAFLKMAKELPLDVRFIELMPFSTLGAKGSQRVLGTEILAAHPELVPIAGRSESQPSEDYQGRDFRGRVGFINPVSHKFCDRCNRIRLTSDGKLRMCLGNDEETDLRSCMNSQPERLFQVMKDAIYNKPEKHSFENYRANRAMNQIGG